MSPARSGSPCLALSVTIPLQAPQISCPHLPCTLPVPHRDVATLGATCRALRGACADGEVWRAQLRSSFPASHLTCADLADFRLAYQLEANGVVPELSCFYSRAPYEVEVLGFSYLVSLAGRGSLLVCTGCCWTGCGRRGQAGRYGRQAGGACLTPLPIRPASMSAPSSLPASFLQFTVNPKSGSVDYCLPAFCLAPPLVPCAGRSHCFRRCCGSCALGSPPRDLRRGSPCFPPCSTRVLCFSATMARRPQVGGVGAWRDEKKCKEGANASWRCSAWLSHSAACCPVFQPRPLPHLFAHAPSLCPSLPAERALNTYCGLHRLLLALCDRHGLWERAERSIGRFLSQEVQRTKKETPNLGLMVPLLALSRRHDWRDVSAGLGGGVGIGLCLGEGWLAGWLEGGEANRHCSPASIAHVCHAFPFAYAPASFKISLSLPAFHFPPCRSSL